MHKSFVRLFACLIIFSLIFPTPAAKAKSTNTTPPPEAITVPPQAEAFGLEQSLQERSLSDRALQYERPEELMPPIYELPEELRYPQLGTIGRLEERVFPSAFHELPEELRYLPELSATRTEKRVYTPPLDELPEELRYPLEETVLPEGRIYTSPTAEEIALTQAHVESFDCATVTDVPPIECEALVVLYNSTNGAGWTDSTNWLTSIIVGEWYGVTVEGGFVTRLSFHQKNLTGSIPLELSNLSNLVELRLDWNQLSGSIPPELGNLTILNWLRLNDNQLTGLIPSELGGLVNISLVDLSNNSLSGNIPESFINLVNLCTPNDDWPCIDFYGLDLGYNHLNISGYPQALLEFLALKDPDWAETQIFPFTGCDAITEIPVTECEALVALYNSSNGSGWRDSTNWLENANPNSWFGVTVTNGHVTELNLFENNLVGNIPAELGNLTNMHTLQLGMNHLTGSIPPELGNLTSLQWLSLSYNQLSGTIPLVLGSMINLQVLLLIDTQLTGTILPELGNLANLTTLSLGGNLLTGTIPTTLGNLTSLQTLDLGNNQLTGTIPLELGALTNLSNLYLYSNLLTGSIPAWLGSLSNLRELYLGSNHLTGFIPTELGNLANLQNLSLNDNQLSGTIPSELGNLINLYNLDLSHNLLSGSIPEIFTNLVNLCNPGSCMNIYDGLNLGFNSLNTSGYSQALLDFLALKDPDWAATQFTPFTGCDGVTEIQVTECQALVALYNSTNGANWTDNTNWLEYNPIGSWFGVTVIDGHVNDLSFFANQLSGYLPSELGNLSSLQNLELSANQLTGSIPPSLGTLTNLQLLNLSSNQLSGSIPTELGILTSLQNLYLGYNQLSGSIPSQLGSLTSLQRLYLNDNELSGSIPPELGNLANLQSLILNYNNLNGSIPSQLGNLTNLQSLYLIDNQLSGSIPVELGSLSSLLRLDLSYNQLNGNIPANLGDLFNLQELHLNSNQLAGSIPPELGALTDLRMLYLNNNALTGNIPESFTNLVNLCEPSNPESPCYGYYHGLDLSYNSLNTSGYTQTLMDFLALKDPDWAVTQISPFIGCETVTEIPVTECQALIALYNSTDGTNWTDNANWLEYNPISSWFGLTVAEGHIQDILLGNNQLVGSIPSEVGNLSNLQRLVLDNNQISGSIPATLGNLASLQSLYLYRNQLTGTIPPELGNLSNLMQLDLWINQLTGSIPVELGGLINLDWLELGGNQFTGPIPAELGQLTNLTTLEVGSNQLTGAIPPELGNLINLQSLGLSRNQLTGVIPEALGNLTYLNLFGLSYNQLSGNIPESLTNLVNLCEPSNSSYPCWGRYGLDLGNNSLNTIGYSQTLLNFLALKDPDWASTQISPFTGCDGVTEIPVTECQALVALYNSTNGAGWIDSTNWLTGTEVGNWYGVYTQYGRVTALDLSSNQLTGSIPPELGNLTSLWYLYLDSNQLTGSIPSQLGNLINLRYLLLNFNQLSGTIPHELGSLTNLTTLDLSNNILSGDVPDSFTTMINLCEPSNQEYPCWGSYGLNLGYNHLNVPAPEPPASFLAIKDPDWHLTQAVQETLPEGTDGTIVSNDENTEIDIPAGALPVDTTFLFDPQPYPNQGSGGLSFAGNSFQLTASADGEPVIIFAEPLVVTLHYDEASLGAITEDSLQLLYWDTLTTGWQDAVTTCEVGEYTRNLAENWLSLPICHLSEFALMGEENFIIYLPLIRR